MPDIAKCSDVNCHVKNRCYRYLVKPDYMQSYIVPSKINEKCEYFWDVHNEKIDRVNGGGK